MVKRAVLIGVNYPGTEDELLGCVNDVWIAHDYLIEVFGFEEENIDVLIDTDEKEVQPTGKNIRAALNGLVDSAEPGDVLYVHFSGHGTRVKGETSQDDDTGFEECIIPCDDNYIFDNDIRDIVSRVPKGCSFTFVSDSCHSGGLIDSAKEQIGESFKKKPRGSTSENQDGENKVNVKSRFLPIEAAIDMLKQKTGRDNIKVGNIRMTLFDEFGEDASPQVKKFMKVIYSNLRQKRDEGSQSEQSHCEEVYTEHNIHEEFKVEHSTCDEHYTYSESVQLTQSIEEDSISEHSIDDEDTTLEHIEELETEFLEEKLNDEEYWKPLMEIQVKNKNEVYAGAGNGGLPDNGILLSGCQSNQTSTDVRISEEEAYGAFTKSIQTILVVTEGNISYKDLVSKARKLLEKNGYRQRPGLYCTDSYVDAQFIC